MKINRRQLEKLNEINRFIIEKSYYFSDYEEDIIFTGIANWQHFGSI